MKIALLALLAGLLVLCARAQPISRSERCRCSDGFISGLRSKFIKGRPSVQEPSDSCPHLEILILTTAGKLKCVDPESLLGKLILNRHKKAAVTKATQRPESSTNQTTSWP